MDSSYRQEPLTGGRVRFAVTAASAPRARGTPLVLAGIFALVVIGTLGAGTNSFWLLVRFAVAIFGARFIYRATHRWFASRIDKVRSPGGTFVVSPDGIETLSGPAIPRDGLHRLVLRNGIPDTPEAGVVRTGSVHSGMAAGGRDDRIANRHKAGRVSWMLCAESGGRSTTLAGGMTEVTARGLLTDASRVLGMD